MQDIERGTPATSFTSPARRPAATIDPESTVNDAMRLYPIAVRVFNAFGVDACCGGANSLAEAALDANVPVETLLAALEGAIAEDGTKESR